MSRGLRTRQARGLSRGFTLVEMMIVVVIVAILAAIAYPSYIAFMQQSRRTDATRSLSEAAAALEQFFSQRQTYVGAALSSTGVYPNTSTQGYYALSFGAGPTATTYTLTATPVAGKAQAGDPCGAFSLTSLGARSVTGTLPSQTCWGTN